MVTHAKLALLVVVLFLVSVATGPVWWPWRLGNEVGWAIVLDLRLPRAVLGVLVGAALGLSGAVLQAWLRNPLAEPGVIGVSACASFAAVCAFYSGLAAAFALALPLAGITGAALAVAGLMMAVRAGTGTVSLLLMGVAINAIAAALISLVLALAPNPFAFQEIWLWLAGSIADRDMRHILVSASFIVAGAGLVLMNRRWLDALSLGEDAARSLGVDTRRLGLWLTLAVGLMVGAATAVAGMIGFVGLVAPHLVRAHVGFKPGATLVPSMLVGAILVLAADIAVRVLPTSYELQLGVFTSLVGAPFLVRVIRRTRASWLAA
ncbi:FecCD family ABC transporter permease [Reyranella sp.]|uniref:FecCD family ABC transporter permease n=1 Tax=Reyranella sp. TaxID=1929291 RepID=UPI003D0C6E0A